MVTVKRPRKVSFYLLMQFTFQVSELSCFPAGLGYSLIDFWRRVDRADWTIWSHLGQMFQLCPVPCSLGIVEQSVLAVSLNAFNCSVTVSD